MLRVGISAAGVGDPWIVFVQFRNNAQSSFSDSAVKNCHHHSKNIAPAL